MLFEKLARRLPVVMVFAIVAILVVQAMRAVAAAPEVAKPSAPAAMSLPHVQVSAAPDGGFLAFDAETGDVVKVAVNQQKFGVEWTARLSKTPDGKWEFKGADTAVAGGNDAALRAAAEGTLTVLKSALDLYKADTGKLPSTEEGLQALVVQPPAAENWKGPYLKKLPMDPWGNPYVYRWPGKTNPNQLELLSFGPDQRDGGGDDLLAK